jgi:hypothetical protein
VDRFAGVALLFLAAAFLLALLQGEGTTWLRSKFTGRVA